MCFEELLDFDREERISVGLTKIAQLMLAWQDGGKRVLLAGDSLIMEYAKMLRCAGIYLGAKVTRKPLVRYIWDESKPYQQRGW